MEYKIIKLIFVSILFKYKNTDFNEKTLTITDSKNSKNSITVKIIVV